MAKEIVLTPGEVCVILKACSDSNVAAIKYGNLNVQFGLPAVPPAPVLSRNPETALSEEQHRKQGKASLQQDEIRLREEQLALLQIENPLAAEELMLKEGLNGEGA